MSKQVHKPWTPDEEELLRRHYGRVHITQLMQMLGRTKPSISNRAGQLGLRRIKERLWTESDFEFLVKSWGKVPLHRIARKLKRSPVAIKVKAKRLKLGKQRDPRLITANGAADLLRVDVHAVCRWVDRGWLFATLAPVPREKILQIDPDELLRFLREHPDAWDARKCPNIWRVLRARKRDERPVSSRVTRHIPEQLRDKFYEFVAEVADELAIRRARDRAPEWLTAKLAQDRAKPEREGQKWTWWEDRRLEAMLKQGMSYPEAGRLLGRSGTAVCHRVARGFVFQRTQRPARLVAHQTG